MTPQHLNAATSALAFVRGGFSAPPSHVEKTESTVSSITNSNKDSSNDSSDNSISPAKTYNDRKRKKDRRFTDVPRHPHESCSHSAHHVSNLSSAGASSEQKSSSNTDSSPPKQTSKKQKLSNKKLHSSDDQDQDEVFAAGMDPTTTEGQLALNPTLTEAKAKVAAKREYNRRNAAQARKRNKNTLAELQERLSCLTKRAEDLSRSNDVLKTQVDGLKTRNRELMASRSAEEQTTLPSVSSYASSNNNNKNDTISQLEALQKQNDESQQRQQEQQRDTSISQLLRRLAAGQHGTASNVLPQLQSGLLGGNTQLLNALLQSSATPAYPPVRLGLQNQGSVLGAQQPHYRQTSQPPPQNSDLRQLISSMSADTLVSLLSQSSGNK
jgi:hypothetical protein